MTWQQDPLKESIKKQRAFYLVNWTFFVFSVFVSVYSLFFAKNAVLRIWPAVVDFYTVIGMYSDDNQQAFAVQNVSNFFVHKNEKLYMGLKGELANMSDEIRELPSITISLKDELPSSKNSCFEKIWTHSLTRKKLLPNQKITFETELQSIPCNNLICDIKLDIL
jgi:hypothetical protein